MEENKRDFKGIWIPKEIYLNKELSWTEKILLVEVDSLDRGEGCFASNEYFGKFLGRSIGQIANVISKLRSRKLLITKHFDGRKRFISCNPDLRKTIRQTSGKPEGRLKENLKYSNTVNNTVSNTVSNTVNNTEEELTKERKNPPSLRDVKEYINLKNITNVKANEFYKWYKRNNFKDINGKLLTTRNYKAKINTWSMKNNAPFTKGTKNVKKTRSLRNPPKCDYSTKIEV